MLLCKVLKVLMKLISNEYVNDINNFVELDSYWISILNGANDDYAMVERDIEQVIKMGDQYW